MNPNDAAFPYDQMSTAGMTKREYIATQALVGILAMYAGHGVLEPGSILATEQAVEYADALITRLNET